MAKKLTQEEFVEKAIAKHGNKYDYSKAIYLGGKQKICIICPEHGEFWQQATSHILGHGCPKCGFKAYERKTWGIGINDICSFACYNHLQPPYYVVWKSMLKRCYSKEFHDSSPTYKECSVCEEWLILSNFKRWFDEHYVEGWHLDKDVLIKGNKLYSPQTCCFVPPEVNFLILRKQNHRGECPIGVQLSENKKKYKAFVTKESERVFLGRYNSVEEAFQAYKISKEAWIKEVADKWKDQLEPRVYEALMNYKVEITD